MEDTRQRIKEYTGRLVRLREKVVAVALLLVISASMLTTVSFAWLALSTNPEVSDVSTSIASNGNLEIALASGTMDDPTIVGPSQVGDSNLPTLERNITWGNIINLADPAYGLERLVLRPALLNKSNLLSKPLHGPVYDMTGRVIDMDTNFGYAKLLNGVLTSTKEIGVRAITSMRYGEAGAVSVYNNALNVVESANTRSQTNYQGLANNKSYMDALASMMTGYMVQNNLKVNSSAGGLISDATLKGADLTQFALMYDEMILRYEEQAAVFASLLNLYAEVNAYDAEKQAVVGTPTSITGAELLALEYSVANKTAYNKLATQFGLLANGKYTGAKKGFIIAIDQFLSDYHLMIADAVRIKDLRDYVNGQSGKSIKWPNCPTLENSTVRIIDDIINNFTVVNNCTISGSSYENGKVIKISSVGATAALSLKNSLCETKITNGILYNFDTFTGARIKNPEGTPLVLTVQAMGTQTIRSNVSTSATDNYFENERVVLAEAIKTKIGQPTLIAEDSYGFAVDFWVRTNAQGSFLTLQGNVLTETEIVEVMGKDRNGVEVQLYTISVKAETEEETDPAETTAPVGGGILDDLATVTYDIYMSTDTRLVLDDKGEPVVDGEGNAVTEEVPCWRYADTHAIVADEYVAEYNFENKLPPKKIEEIEHVIGFEGDNRVWDDSGSFLTVNSTTQGSGSCYVFYSENPVDQARIMVLLKSMKVAFVDAQGNLLATAYMDTEHHYATTGKVIVPLVLDPESLNIGADDQGNIRYAITALEQNVATLITAVFYLDGEEITNGDVLAAADIRGQMNIQFGSSALLAAVKDETLYNAELGVTGEIDGRTEFEYGVDTDLTTKVKISVVGDTPASMKAYFIRKINSTQGSPEESFILTDSDKDGIWEGSYTFAYPGEYILRSVQVDGTDRELSNPSGQFPTVKVNGFSITKVTYSEADGAAIMTDAASYPVDVELWFATSDRNKMPNTVVGQFMRGDGAVATVRFTYDPRTTSWRGRAVFVSSGEYKMEFVELDGKYEALGEGQTRTLDFTLGMYVDVKTTSPSSPETLVYGDPATPSSLQVQVGIYDNNGDPVRALGRAGLNYTAGGSTNLYTALTWNSVEEYYEGEFRVEAGIWRFQNVKITMGEGEGTTNTLTSVKGTTPVFIIIPPTPPSYLQTGGDATQYTTGNNGGSVSVSLWNSEAATVFAKLVKLDLNGREIADSAVYVPSVGMVSSEGTLNGETAKYYTYTFPVESSGLWKIESVSAYNVIDASMTLHRLPDDGVVDTEEEYQSGLLFGGAEFETRSVAVLKESDITLEVVYTDAGFTSENTVSKTGYYGKDHSNGMVSGVFMQSYTIPAGGIEIRFTDKSNSGLLNSKYFTLENVKLGYKYGSGNSDTTYGGYTSGDAAIQSGLPFQTLEFSGSANNVYRLSAPVTFQYAAKYTPSEITFDVKPTSGAVNSNVINSADKLRGEYTIEVWSNAPTVAITGAEVFQMNATAVSIASGGTQYNISEGSGSKGGTLKTQTSSWSATEATLYMFAKMTDGGSCGSDTYNYSPVRLYMQLAGSGYADKVTLTFVHDTTDSQVMFYTAPASWSSNFASSGSTEAFEWSDDGTAWRWVGFCESKENGTKTPAKALSAQTLLLTYGGQTYTVQLGTTIKVNNPY
ncbi:MAG: hypothetical protein IJC93_04925 [Clostridia bacterium]|nr:hypothetical protein [Clostridia bacterium]